jgi:hypothetical protein
MVRIPLIPLVSCATTPNAEYDTYGPYTYQPPEIINDGLDVGTLEEVNIDEKLIIQAVNKIHQGKYKEVHSIVIFKYNKQVIEEYFPVHGRCSTGKTAVGCLIQMTRQIPE